MQFDRGYLSPYFVTNAEKMLAELEDAYILIHEKKLSSLQPMLPLLEAVVQAGKPLLIIAEDIEGERWRRWSSTAARRPKVAAVKALGFGDRRKAMLEDIAVLTAGNMIAEDLGIKPNVTLQMLGKAKRVRIEKENTTINGAGAKKDIEGRIAQIKAQIEDTTFACDKEKPGASGRFPGRRRHHPWAARPRSRLRRRKIASRTPERDEGAVEEGIVSGGASRCSAPKRRSASSATKMKMSNLGSTSC
jgi:hypothetical protein